jgi:hypothetical protein
MSTITTKTQRYQLIEITIPANFGGNTLPIPDQPMLRDKRVQKIELYLDISAKLSPLTGNNTIDLGIATYSALTIYSADPVSEHDTGEYWYRMPLLALNNSVTDQTSVNTSIQRDNLLDDLSIQWDKCYLTFQGAPVGQNVPYAILLGVYYTSRRERLFNALSKKLSGISEGSFADMLIGKLMMLEAKVTELTNKLRNK